MSASSMLSAPAHIAAISVASFGAGLAAPDLIRGALICTFSSSSRDRPACSASATTGTSPAHDTRLSSSNTADSGANLWDTCTGSAFLEPVWLLREEHQSSQLRGHFPQFDTQNSNQFIGGSRLSLNPWIGDFERPS